MSQDEHDSIQPDSSPAGTDNQQQPKGLLPMSQGNSQSGNTTVAAAAQRNAPPPTTVSPAAWKPANAQGPDPDGARRILAGRTPTRATWTPGNTPRPGVQALAAVASNTVQGPASIVELARALKNDADLIFEWVYTNIEFTPTWGVQRGALTTLIEGRGNAIDMSMLLVELFRAAGYTANYMIGDIELPASVATNWLGTVANPAWVTDRVLNFGGIPTSYTWVSPDDLDKQTLTHCYVKCTISGTAYMFDPAVKAYTYKTGMNLATAMSYSQSTFISDALSGSSQTSNYIDDLNRGNVRSKLTTYANNLVSYIKTNNPAASLDDVLTGRTINALSGPVRNTVHPYKKTGSTHTESTSISSSYFTTLRIQVSGIDVTVNSHDIADKRLTLYWNSSNQPVLRSGGTTVATGTAATPDTWEALTFTITHNGIASVNVNQTVSTWAWVSQTQYMLIGQNWGTAGRGPVEHHNRLFTENEFAGTGAESEPVLGEKLASMWAHYNSLASASFNLIDRIGASWTSIFHNVGMITFFSGGNYTVSDWGAMFTTLTVDGNTTKELANAQACILAYGTLEGLAALQVGIDVDAVTAANTVDTGIAQSNKIYDATSSNWSTSVRPNLLGYSSGELTTLDGYVTAGYRLIIPERGDIVQGGWTGDGLFAIDSGGGIVHYINGTKGSNSKNNGAGKTPPKAPTPPTNRTGGDPVDMFTGAFVHNETDISVGSAGFPYGLAFERYYNSNNRLVDGPLGLGWTHNFATTATVSSDGFQGLGEDSAIDAAASIAAFYVAFDLLNQTARPLERWAMQASIYAWWQDQLWRNVVAVKAGDTTLLFVKLADGTYNPPPNSADVLTLSGGVYTLKTPQQIQFNFNSAGDISSWVDPAGVTVSFTYTSGKLTSVSNGMGRTLTLSYTGDRLTSVSDGTGRSVSYSVNSTSKQLTSFTDPDSKATTYGYGLSGQMTQVFLPQNPISAVVTNVFDTLGRVKEQKDALNNQSNFYFAGSRSELVDPGNNRWINYWSPRGILLKEVDPLGNATVYELDGLHRVKKVTMPESNRVEFTFDAKNNVLTRTYKAKTGSGLSDIVHTFTWHSTFNKVLTAQDGRGNTTTMSYDATKGTLLTIQRPAVGGSTPTVTMTWNTRGQLATRVDETGIETRWNYDTTTEKLLSVVEDYGTSPHLNLTTTFGHNSRGDITSVQNPRSHTTTLDYDLCRRLKQQTDPSPLSYVTKWTYDSNGSLTKIERQTGDAVNPWQTTNIEYSLTGKRKKIIDPVSNFVTFDYDGVDRLWKITDEETRLTTLAYDALSRISTITDPSGTVAETRTYTNNGLLASLKDARNKTTSFSFDGHDRLDRRTFHDSSYEQHQSYDANGNVLTYRTRSGNTIVSTFDALNRLSTRAPQGHATLTFTYDLAGRLTKASKPVVSGDPSTGDHDRYHDSAGRFYKERYPDLKVVEHVLDANGNATKTTWPDGYYVERVFDQLNRLTDIKLNGAGSSALVFQYNDLSLRKRLTYQNGCQVDYGFELDNDVNSIVQTFVGSSVTFTYGHDKTHLLTSQSVSDGSYMWHPGAGGTVTYGTADDTNKYPTVGGVTQSHDSNGNLTGDGTWTFGYNTENQLTSASKTGVSASYVYDPLDRQTQKTVGSAKTRFIYAGWQCIAEYDGVSGNLVSRYVHGTGLDEPLIEVSSGGTLTYFHHDQIGSIIARTNASGTVTQKYKYSPFGESAALTGTSFGFQGQRYDSEHALYYMKHRYYAPVIGRFLQPDLLVPEDPEGGLNLYTFVENDPLDLTDPLGLAPVKNTGDRTTLIAQADRNARTINQQAIQAENARGLAGQPADRRGLTGQGRNNVPGSGQPSPAQQTIRQEMPRIFRPGTTTAPGSGHTPGHSGNRMPPLIPPGVLTPGGQQTTIPPGFGQPRTTGPQTTPTAPPPGIGQPRTTGPQTTPTAPPPGIGQPHRPQTPTTPSPGTGQPHRPVPQAPQSSADANTNVA